MEFATGLSQLASKGLNIFASVPLHELPVELRAFAPDPRYDYYSLCVFGHGGSALWKALPHPLVAEAHPIDRFTLEQVSWLMASVFPGEDVVLAFPRPDWVLPLQKLGRFLNLSRPSLLGLDMSLEFGPWFAFRGVILTSAKVPRTVGQEFSVACLTCAEKPCQKVCPAQAITPDKFRLGECASYRLSRDSRCADRCLARLACPVKAQHRYSLEQIQYHMGRPAHLAKLRGFDYRPEDDSNSKLRKS